MAGYIAALLLSVALLSVLFFPILEGLTTMGTLDDYSKRIFFPIYFPNSILSFFTPTHFFELYNSMEEGAVLWSVGSQKNGFNGNTVYHFGLISLIFISSTLHFKNIKSKAIIISCYVAVFFFLLRLFNPFLIDAIYSHIPIIRNLGAQYLWSGIFIPCILLVGFGVDALRDQKKFPWQQSLVLLVGLFSIYIVYDKYGFRDPFIDFKRNSVKIFIFYELFVFIILLIVYKFNSLKNKVVALSLLVLLMLVELLIGSKWVHTKRIDFFNNPPEITQFLIDNVKLNRTMTVGIGAFTPELGSAFNVQEITSHNQGVFPDYVAYFQNNFKLNNVNQMAYGVSLMNAKDTPEENSMNFGALNFLGVRYIVMPKDFTKYKNFFKENGLYVIKENNNTIIYENPNILPRAFTLRDEFKEDIFKKDLNKLTIKDVVPAEIKNYQNSTVIISGAANTKSLFVLSDNWHPNWRAKLNGKHAEIIKINQSFRGMIINPGAYEIEMEYRPRTLNLAIVLSLLSLTLLGLIFAFSYFKK